MTEPCDWDGTSYCTECRTNPATHRHLNTFIDGTPVIDMVCCGCATRTPQAA